MTAYEKKVFAGGVIALLAIAGGIGWLITGSPWWMAALIPAPPAAYPFWEK